MAPPSATMMANEVSLVFEHFRPQPEFMAQKATALRRSSHRAMAGFSRIQYQHSCHGCILVSFVFDQKIRLDFDISCQPPYTVTCSQPLQNGPSTDTELRLALDKMCGQLEGSSLVAVTSNLLKQLQTLTRDPQPPPSNTAPRLRTLPPRLSDLALFLLYYAGTSPKSATVCSPVPRAFRHANGDVWIQRLLACVRKNQTRSLDVFLGSLMWTKGAKVRCVSGGVGAKHHAASQSVQLCLDPDYGDPLPTFSQRAQCHGTMTVYHGTQMDKVWSVLQYGLLNLSSTSLQQNGAAFGKGVYFSTSRDVALFFSHKYSATAQWLALQHPPALQRLLGSAARLEDATVVCSAVFEATIIAPSKHDPKGPRQEGKYYMVPRNEDIRIDKLHLTITLKPQVPTSAVRLVIGVVLFLVLLLVAKGA